MINSFLDKLNSLKEKNLYRSLTTSSAINATTIKRQNKKLTSFACNDYFSLSQNSSVKKAAINAIKKYGVGARASRYVTGNNELYQKLEKQIAELKKTDDAIVFSSGYAAAIGVIPALVEEGDLIIADRLIHSSLIDGAKLSQARFIRFRHNAISHLEEILKENRSKFKKCLIITESVFSMDGDLGEISELLEIVKKYDCFLLTDYAHDLWISDKHNDERYIKIGTLSKAVGTLGGYVAADKITIDYLRNFAKTAIYSTALPPAVLAASIASLKIISKKKLGKRALENAQYFCQLMKLPKAESAIVVIIIGDNKKVLEIAKNISNQGFLISAIRPPTVENGKARLRLTFSSEYKKAEIKKLADTLFSIIA